MAPSAFTRDTPLSRSSREKEVNVKGLLIGALLLAASAPGAGRTEPTVTKMALVTITASADVSAVPARVWSALTDADKVQSWCSLWKAAPAKESLSAVGRTIAFLDEYGNAGSSVVVFVSPGKELRIDHVPDNGSYLCQTHVRIVPRGTGARIEVVEQYSDQLDVPLDADTAVRARQSIVESLDALKKLVEEA